MTQINTRRGFTQQANTILNNKSHSRRFLSGIPTTFNHKKGGDPRLQISGMTHPNNRHAEGSLLSISSALTTQGRDPEQKRFRMTLWNNGAFALIELLVVVLIIGILAAVALPQYNKAVRKAQVTEVLTAMDALNKGVSAYYLEHDNYGTEDHFINANDLGVDLPILKHFKYANSHTYLNSPGYEFQIGSGHAPWGKTMYDFYQVSFKYDQGDVNIMISWLDGKLYKKQCYSSSSTAGNVSCADFFSNCPPPKNVGTGSPSWQSNCDI